MNSVSSSARDMMQHFTFSVEKISGHKTGSYTIIVEYRNPRTARVMKKKFRMMVPAHTKKENADRWNVNIIAGVAFKYFQGLSRKDLIERKSKRQMGLEIYHNLRIVSRRKGSDTQLSDLERVGKAYLDKEVVERMIRFSSSTSPNESTTSEEQALNQKKEGEVHESTTSLKNEVLKEIQSKVTPIPSESIFKPEETGVTYAMIGKSFSGKTTFIVNELNKLTEEQLEEYNAIIFFTESSHAQPLKNLAPHIKPKTILIDRFCPKVLQALKRVNDATKLRFKFLVIFDDIINLRGNLITKCILTLRNSNISTVISIQYEKLLNPAQRSSVHNMFLFNLRSESWEFLLKGYLLGNVKELLPASLGEVKSAMKVSQMLRETMDPFILYYNQREDKTSLWNKKNKT
jgi:hypothetical protein